MTSYIATFEVSSLVPALITTSVALLIFAANQWLLFISKRSDVLREKLEHLWKALLIISRQTRPITAYGNDLNEDIARNLHERAHQLLESLLEPTTFIALYFPQLKCRYSRVNKACGELAEIMRRPPITGKKGETLEMTYVKMLQKSGFTKELMDASERAKKEVGDLQIYMRANQSILIKTLAGMIQDRV